MGLYPRSRILPKKSQSQRSHANRIAIVRRNGGFITSKNTKNATRIAGNNAVIILIGDFSSLFFFLLNFFCEITRIVHLSCKILNNIHWHFDPRTKRLKNCITILVKEYHYLYDLIYAKYTVQ